MVQRVGRMVADARRKCEFVVLAHESWSVEVGYEVLGTRNGSRRRCRIVRVHGPGLNLPLYKPVRHREGDGCTSVGVGPDCGIPIRQITKVLADAKGFRSR